MPALSRLVVALALAALAVPSSALAAESITGTPPPSKQAGYTNIVPPQGGCVLSATKPYWVGGNYVRSIGRAYCWGTALRFPVRLRVCADYASYTSPNVWYQGNCNPSTTTYTSNGTSDITLGRDQVCRSPANYYRTRSVGHFNQGGYWFPIGSGSTAYAHPDRVLTVTETSTEPSWPDKIEARVAAGLPVEPEIVATIPYGWFVRYWDGTLGLRRVGGEMIFDGPATWDGNVAGWPHHALVFGPAPPGRAPLDSRITVIEAAGGETIYYGVVPTNTARIGFDGGYVIELPALCAGKD